MSTTSTTTAPTSPSRDVRPTPAAPPSALTSSGLPQRIWCAAVRSGPTQHRPPRQTPARARAGPAPAAASGAAACLLRLAPTIQGTPTAPALQATLGPSLGAPLAPASRLPSAVPGCTCQRTRGTVLSASAGASSSTSRGARRSWAGPPGQCTLEACTGGRWIRSTRTFVCAPRTRAIVSSGTTSCSRPSASAGRAPCRSSCQLSRSASSRKLRELGARPRTRKARGGSRGEAATWCTTPTPGTEQCPLEQALPGRRRTGPPALERHPRAARSLRPLNAGAQRRRESRASGSRSWCGRRKRLGCSSSLKRRGRFRRQGFSGSQRQPLSQEASAGGGTCAAARGRPRRRWCGRAHRTRSPGPADVANMCNVPGSDSTARTTPCQMRFRTRRQRSGRLQRRRGRRWRQLPPQQCRTRSQTRTGPRRRGWTSSLARLGPRRGQSGCLQPRRGRRWRQLQPQPCRTRFRTRTGSRRRG